MSMAEAVGSTSGGSGSEDSVADGGARAKPLAIYSDVLERLVAGGHAEASRSGSLLALQAHFAQLPISYHQYVDAGKAEYVLIHQKVLAEAKADRSRPAFHAHYLRVMKHQQYGPAADVYSFSIVLWELMTSKMPYDTMNPIQAAVNVCEGMRPPLPENAHPRLLTLMQRCWDASPSERPPFSDAITELEDIKAEVQGATSRKLDPSDPTA